MDSYKLKVRIGSDEFEAEGPQEAVERQFAAFSDLISSRQANPQSQIASQRGNLSLEQQATASTVERLVNGDLPDAAAAIDAEIEAQNLTKIFRSDGKILSLTALPQGNNREGEAALLLLLGHKLLRAADVVGVVDLLGGLRQSGCSVGRFDRLISDAIPELVIKSGQRIGAKYRLTNQGMAKAQSIAQQLIALVA